MRSGGFPCARGGAGGEDPGVFEPEQTQPDELDIPALFAARELVSGQHDAEVANRKATEVRRLSRLRSRRLKHFAMVGSFLPMARLMRLIVAVFLGAVFLGAGLTGFCAGKPTTRLVSKHKAATAVHSTRKRSAHGTSTAAKRRGHGSATVAVAAGRVQRVRVRGRNGRWVYVTRRTRYVEHFTASSFAENLTLGDVTAGEDPVVRAAAIEALGNMNGTALAIDPSSGRILAMVNQKLALSSAGAEPCSTIKVAVALAGLEEKASSRTTRR